MVRDKDKKSMQSALPEGPPVDILLCSSNRITAGYKVLMFDEICNNISTSIVLLAFGYQISKSEK